MIKKSTLIVLVCAALLGGGIYYWQRRGAEESKATKKTSKPAFSMAASDIASFTITHPIDPSQPAIHFEKKNGVWKILQPVETDADQSTAQGIADQLAALFVSETEPGGASRKNEFGLVMPQTSLEFQLRNGTKHTILIGDEDFDHKHVYAILDGSPNVSLLPVSFSASTNKTLEELRDRAVLHIQSADVASFNLRNPSGDFVIARDKKGWKFTKPADALADTQSVNQLLAGVADGQMTGVVSERPVDLARYGLANPVFAFTATDSNGKKSTLVIGKKDGDGYDARDLARPMIFRVSQDLYNDLAENFGDLQDKNVVHLDSADIQRIQIRNSHGMIEVAREKSKPDEWVINSPAGQKGKIAESWRVVDPLTGLRAAEVIDHPSAGILASLKMPLITAVLTSKDGKKVTLNISKVSGDYAYARASDVPVLYKLKKQNVYQLNFDPADASAGGA